jgi:hypothetical protein
MIAVSSEARAARISSEVRAVADMALPALRLEWRRRWGEPPKFRSRDLLARAMAYRLQVEVHGDLPAPMRRRMAAHAERFTADRAYSPGPGVVLKPGSSLVREWGGVRHEVAVMAVGFTYQGRSFRSLSQVAGHITGTKWNGHVFFGLKPRGKTA